MCCRRFEPRRRNARKAFSLVEVMIVIVIIGMLATVVTVSVRSYINKARQNTARHEIATIIEALDTFYSIYSRYPTNEEGVEILARSSEKLPDPLLSKLPVDPWGNHYQYNDLGRGDYEVICYGADGREGGDGIDADISSKDLRK